MKMVGTQAVASQVQETCIFWEGGDLPVLQEDALQGFSFLDVTQVLDEGILPEIAGLLREGGIQLLAVIFTQAGIHELDGFNGGGECWLE